MPELPEVETVRRGLTEIFPEPFEIDHVEVREARLRERVQPHEMRQLRGVKVGGFLRRAKYLLWETEELMVVSHLGMTGSWRVAADLSQALAERRTHDHLLVHLRADPRVLIYNDPRRFGVFRVVPKAHWEEYPLFCELGPEPFDTKRLTAKGLLAEAQGRTVAIKNFIMNQTVVVGIGNIYASEILFRAGVRPQRPARQVSLKEFGLILSQARRILNTAIESGGTTFRDFRQTGGEVGHFYRKLRVYEREGEPCRVCRTLIRQSVIGGRSSYWCPSCQK